MDENCSINRSNGEVHVQKQSPSTSIFPTPIQSTQQQSTRFADYFVICGLDLDTGLEPDRFAGKQFSIFVQY